MDTETGRTNGASQEGKGDGIEAFLRVTGCEGDAHASRGAAHSIQSPAASGTDPRLSLVSVGACTLHSVRLRNLLLYVHVTHSSNSKCVRALPYSACSPAAGVDRLVPGTVRSLASAYC